MSLMEGIFLSELKLAKVVSILKSGESDKGDIIIGVF